MDESWHPVTLRGAAIYVACEDPEVQLLQTWSGGEGPQDSIGIILRRGSILTADIGCLYMVNDEDAVNPEGYPVT